jgi:hypothetical protein
MPKLPTWLVLAVGVLVILFGLFRVKVAFRSREEEEVAKSRGGLFGYPRRTHALFGIVYVLMGLMLILGGLGVKMPWVPR